MFGLPPLLVVCKCMVKSLGSERTRLNRHISPGTSNIAIATDSCESFRLLDIPIPVGHGRVLSRSISETKRRCGFFLEVFGLSLPDYLECELFPENSNPDECIGHREVIEAAKRAENPGK